MNDEQSTTFHTRLALGTITYSTVKVNLTINDTYDVEPGTGNNRLVEL